MPLILFWTVLLISGTESKAQEVRRPAIWGIAKMTFLVSDFQLASDYYDKFLGFDEAFSYPSDQGKVISFKVNDRQFLEFVADKEAKNKKRLVSVSFETENVEQMRQYLKSKGQNVPEKTIIDGAGNEVFSINDPSGNQIEFISLEANGLHRKSKGKYLSDRRIAKRIHHAGLFAEKIEDNDPFYAKILNFKELMRYPDDRNAPPLMLYLSMDDCIENIEIFPSTDPNVCHPCFLVDDMQETIYTLKERRENESLGKPMIGKGKRWILNIANTDKTRVEFTEAHTVR